jgi:hypothetical protein
MLGKNGRRFDLVIAAGALLVACGQSKGSGIDARDALGAPEVKSDALVVTSDTDTVLITPDASPDTAARDSADGATGVAIDQGRSVEAGPAPGCTEGFGLGGLLSLVPTGQGAASLGLADVDGDGKLDLVTGNSGENTVSVMLGDGRGRFSPRNSFAAGDHPVAMALGDLNGDGEVDIAVVDAVFEAYSISVLLGKGDGTFARKTDYPIGKDAFAILLGDLNGDHKPDLITPSRDAGTVSVLLGKGDGTFADAVDYPAGGHVYGVALGDLDNDGSLDIAAAVLGPGAATVLLGKGDGTFAPKVDYPAGGGPIALALGDVNNDGKLDIATTTYDTNALNVLLGQGDGTFAAPVATPVPEDQGLLVLGDLNRDGKLDALVREDSVLSILYGRGDGTFADQLDYRVGGNVRNVVVADLNADGRPDLAVAIGDSPTDAVNVMLGAGDGTFGTRLVAQPTGENPRAMVLADVNRDGKLEVITANGGASTVSVLAATGAGMLAAKVDYAVGGPATAVVLGDLNNDGRLDIVTNAPGGVLLGAENGGFAPGAKEAAAIGAAGLALGDLNADGKLDVASANPTSGYMEKGTVSVRLGLGDGTFASKADYAVGVNPRLVALGDLDGDHQLDMIVGSLGSGDGGWSLSVLAGKGDGAFAPASGLQARSSPNTLVLVDLNGDGKLDIVTGNSMSFGVSVWLGNGDRTFATGVDVPGYGTQSATIGDIDGDDRPDIVTVNSSSGLLSVLLGKGDGTFPSKISFALAADWLALGDLDGNGRPDLVAVSARSSTATVLLDDCR